MGPTLERYLRVFEERNLPFEVIVVSDQPGDGTADVARAFSSRNVRVIEFPRKLGKGGAVLAGLRQASYEYVGYLDADGPIPPADFLKLSEALRDVDGVIASRWLRESRVLRQEPFLNVVAGRVWNFLVRSVLLLPIRDTQCGAKLFRRTIVLPTLKAVALTNRAFDVDLLYHLRKSGCRLREVPVTWEHNSDSRMPIARAIPVMFVSLVGVRVMNTSIGRRIPIRYVQWFLERWPDR